MTKLADTGERMIPEAHKGQIIYGEHINRYESVLPLVKGKTILDIACGSGYGSNILSRSARKVFGVDISEESVQYAQTYFPRPNIEFKRGDAVAIPLADASVDTVVSFETIEHVKNYKKFLDEIKRVQKKGGLFILSTPNEDEFAEGNHFHVHEFRIKELYTLLKKYFRHVDFYYQGTWLYAGIFSEKDFGKEWREKIETLLAAPLKTSQCIYVMALCSDRKIDVQIPGFGIISQRWSAREEKDLKERTDLHIKKLEKELKRQITEKGGLEKALADKETVLQNLYNSKSWKVTAPLRKIFNLIRR